MYINNRERYRANKICRVNNIHNYITYIHNSLLSALSTNEFLSFKL